MNLAIARLLGVIGFLIVQIGILRAQPAFRDWTCTGWRQVVPTMLNPFGRECAQWTKTSAVSLSQVPPPPVAKQGTEQGPQSKDEKPRAAQQKKSGHAR